MGVFHSRSRSMIANLTPLNLPTPPTSPHPTQPPNPTPLPRAQGPFAYSLLGYGRERRGRHRKISVASGL